MDAKKALRQMVRGILPLPNECMLDEESGGEPPHSTWALPVEDEADDGQRGDYGGFGAENVFAQGGFGETGGARGGDFLVRPAAFGADGEGRGGKA